MELYTRRLVFRSSPSPEPEDQEPNSLRPGLRGELKFEERGDEYFDLGHHEKGAGNGWGMAEPPGEASSWVSKSINGRTELWTPPAGRDSKLEVVKSGSLYDIRAYKGEKKPSRLYGEEEEETRYRIPPEDALPEKVKALEEERREIIRSQVVRKSTTIAEKWSSAEELEAIDAASAGRDVAPGRRSYSTGFAVCFDSPSSGWDSAPVDPQNIDTQEINFAMARQQFLELEKANPKLLLGPQKPPPRSQMARNVHGTGEEQIPDVYGQRRLGWSSEPAEIRIPQRTEPRSSNPALICPNSAGDDWGSGLVEIPSNSSAATPDGRVFIMEDAGDSLELEAGGQDLAEDSDETPIEREIRLAMEREDAHRKERGIPRVNSRDELVEIQTKPLLLSAITSPASSQKGKEKHHVSFSVQREIEQESKREEDLQKEGRLFGTYDRGVCQELSERRKVFERDEAAPMMSRLAARKLGEREEARNGERTTVQEERWHSEAYQSSSASLDSGRRKQGNDLSSLDQNISNQRMDSSARRLSGARVLDDAGEEPAILREEHFAIPVRKLKFSSPGDQGPPISQRKEARPEWAAPREELYTLKTQRPRMSALIDQEIKESLQREMELQEQRRKAGVAMETHSRTSSQSSGIADSYCVSAASPFAPNSPVMWSPSPSPQHAYAGRLSSEPDARTQPQTGASAEEEKTKGHREGGKYAGIELRDEIDSEVVKSTKVVCQRGLLAQLWETGQIRRIGDDSD